MKNKVFILVTFLVCFCSSILCYADTPNDFIGGYNYVTFVNSDGIYYTYSFSNKYICYAQTSTNTIKLVQQSGQDFPQVTVFKWDGDSWEQNSELPGYREYGVGYVEILDSNKDIYDYDNRDVAVFPPRPLWMEIQQKTSLHLAELPTTVGGKMKILVACGISCLALLVVLKVFGKVFRVFRV